LIRRVLFVIAGVVAIHSLWLLLAELISPGLTGFPQSLSAAQAAADKRGRADWAARIALIRGDLWTQAAIADAAQPAFELAMADPTRPRRLLEGLDGASIDRAASWSPHDARAWLLLAATNLAPGGSDVRVIEGLKLSYFTGPNEPELTPLRLAVVTRSRAVNDPDIEQFARQDIQTIVRRLPNLRLALAQAYKSASPEGKKFLTGALSELDPDLLKSFGGTAFPPVND
jgi:hypothetical protein